MTGGASGIGAATVATLRKLGWRIAILDLPAALHSLAPSEDVELLGADVTDADSVRRVVERLPDDFDLRVVVNCAGIAPSARILGKSGAHSAELMRKVVAVNLLGTFNVLVATAERMATNEVDGDSCRGVVINTASIAAFDGQIGQLAYAASKAGVAGMVLPAARDLAAVGIRVCAIAPGLIDTPLLAGFGDDVRARLAADVPFPARLGRPEEFADLVVAIVGNPYLNGETIRMDGALRMAPR